MSGTSSRKISLIEMIKGEQVFLLDIVMPDQKVVSKIHKTSDTVSDVIKTVCKDLEIVCTEMFGLALSEMNEYQFLSQRKILSKAFPPQYILPAEKAEVLRDPYLSAKDTSDKKCAVHLRVKHFLYNVDALSGRFLYYYCEQVRLDALKNQNWLNLQGYREVFNNMACYSLWLTHGPSVAAHLESNVEIAFQNHMPKREWTGETIQLLKEKFKRLNEDMDIDEDKVPNSSSGNFDRLRIDRMDRLCVQGETNHNDIERKIKEYVMISLIKEAAKLPYYGINYHQVRCNSQVFTACELGIGTTALSLIASNDFTTWHERERFTWVEVLDIKAEKNNLYVYEISHQKDEPVLHILSCASEKKAKDIIREVREAKAFQMKIVERQKTGGGKSRSSSVKFLSIESAAVCLTPVISRSTSASFMKFDKEFQEIREFTEPSCTLK